MVPCNVMDWEPVAAVPGLKPRSPVIVVGPVLVIVEPARTAKPSAVPRPTGAWAEAVAGGTSVKETRASPTAPDPSRARSLLRVFIVAATQLGNGWKMGYMGAQRLPVTIQ